MTGSAHCNGGTPLWFSRRKLCACCLVLTLLMGVTTGCWDRVEVNDLAIVQGVALDKAGPNSIKLTVALIVPARISTPASPGAGGGKPPVITKAAEGRTVMEASSVLQEKLSRQIFWSHNQAILIGEELARDGVSQLLEFFTRQRQPRLRTVVAVTPGKAYDVLSVVQSIELNTPIAIREIESFNLYRHIDLRNLTMMLVDDGEDPMIARIATVGSGAPDPSNQGDPRQVILNGTAAFVGDRFVGFVDQRVARGLLWVRNEIQRATLTLELGNSGRYASFQLLRATTKLKPRFEGDRLFMDIRVQAEAELDDNAAGVDASDPEVLGMLAIALGRLIGVYMTEATDKMQHEFGSDVMGFGAAVRRAFPGYWSQVSERWHEVLPTVEVGVHAEVIVRRTGMTSRPMGVKENEVLKAEQVRQLLEGK